MNIEELRDFCLSKKGVEECFPFGPDTIVFKVMGKVFLIADINDKPLHFNVKCDPEKAIELREEYPSVKPGFHMNKKHWNTVTCDGRIGTKLLKDWISHSYALVLESLPKKHKEELELL